MLLQMQKYLANRFSFIRNQNIQVAVDADRKNGIQQLLSQTPEVILLDDAYQHRKVKAGFIFYSLYGELYSDDFMLPTGNLRESRSGIIIVNKMSG
jgi:tetraacyldisaccharide 4'-kinase